MIQMHFWLRLVYKRSRYRELIIEGARDSATRWCHCPIDDRWDLCKTMPICNILEATCDIDPSILITIYISCLKVAFSPKLMFFLLSLQLSPLIFGLWSAIQNSGRLKNDPRIPPQEPILLGRVRRSHAKASNWIRKGIRLPGFIEW